MTSTPNSSDDLLQACRYLNGEMTTAEAATYEDQLATDLSASEALAEAVLLQESLLIVKQEMTANGNWSLPHQLTSPAIVSAKPVSPSHRHWTRKTLIATGLLIGAFILNANIPRSKPTSQPEPVVSVEEELPDLTPLVWVALRDNEKLFESNRSETSDSSQTLEIPNWMYVAVEGFQIPQDEQSDAESFQPEVTL